MEKQSGLVAAVIIFFIGLFIYTRLAGPIPFFVNSIQTTKTGLFQAEGTGTAAGIPNIAKISFGVTKNAQIVKDAQNQVNSNIDTILKSLKSLGLEDKDIKTTNYSIYPNYSGEIVQISGFTASQTIDLTIKKIDAVNQVVDAITTNGGNIIEQVYFDFDDNTKKKLEDEARKEAVNNAKEKAQSLANASGISLGRIVNVDEATPQPPIGMQPLAINGTNGVTSPSNITPGENTIKITVTLSYEIH